MQVTVCKVSVYQLKDLTQLQDFKFRCIFTLKEAKKKLSQMKKSKQEQQVIQILYNFLNSNRSSKHLLHCLHIIDFMILFPCYYNALEKHLAQFYYSIFRWLYQAGDMKAVEQAKIIRKYWLGKINYGLYISIKKSIEQTFDTDLEIIDSDSIENLRHYYQNVLKLTSEQLECHLPQIKSIKSITKVQEEGKKKSSKKELRKKHEENMRKMEEMNIGFRYREYVTAQKERIKQERKASKLKQKDQEKISEQPLKQISCSQLVQHKKNTQETAIIKDIKQGFSCKRRKKRNFQKEMSQVVTKKRFLQSPSSPTKPQAEEIKTASSKSPSKSHSESKSEQSEK